MNDDPRGPGDGLERLTTIFMLLVERATTLSVEVEALRGLLEEHGVVSADEVAQRTAALRARWQLPSHPHASVAEPLTTDEYCARICRAMNLQQKDAPPPADAP